jgi:Protein of unknown function (DUF2628)
MCGTAPTLDPPLPCVGAVFAPILRQVPRRAHVALSPRRADRPQLLADEENYRDEGRRTETTEGMLDQKLISQEEFDKLRSEVLASVSRRVPPPMDDLGRTLGIPAEPISDQIELRDPRTGETVTIKKWPTFWLALLFGCFYLAYHRLWLHAAIAFVAAILTSCLSCLIYPFFTYRLVVDSYRRRGWVDVSPPPFPAGV